MEFTEARRSAADVAALEHLTNMPWVEAVISMTMVTSPLASVVFYHRQDSHLARAGLEVLNVLLVLSLKLFLFRELNFFHSVTSSPNCIEVSGGLQLVVFFLAEALFSKLSGVVCNSLFKSRIRGTRWPVVFVAAGIMKISLTMFMAAFVANSNMGIGFRVPIAILLSLGIRYLVKPLISSSICITLLRYRGYEAFQRKVEQDTLAATHSVVPSSGQDPAATAIGRPSIQPPVDDRANTPRWVPVGGNAHSQSIGWTGRSLEDLEAGRRRAKDAALHVRIMRQARELEAITLIQAAVRGHLARREVAERRTAEEVRRRRMEEEKKKKEEAEEAISKKKAARAKTQGRSVVPGDQGRGERCAAAAVVPAAIVGPGVAAAAVPAGAIVVAAARDDAAGEAPAVVIGAAMVVPATVTSIAATVVAPGLGAGAVTFEVVFEVPMS